MNLENEDLYEILDIPFEASLSEIKKAYRKKALKCHPDKNPGNQNAADEFLRLSKILEILCDDAARRAYDRVLKGRKEAAIRHSQLDSKRKRFKETLEAKEKLVGNRNANKSADQILREEIDRLRTEGSKQVQEEMELMRKLITEPQSKETAFNSSDYRIKLSWKANKTDETNGGYAYENLHRFLSKYGNINVLVLSAKKKGSGMVEFVEKRAAEMAIDIEKGLATNPLTLTWASETSVRRASKSATIKETDFESLTLMKLRQAEERKRLIAQMQQEDAE